MAHRNTLGAGVGRADRGEDDVLRAFEAAGATWWIHSDWNASPETTRRRIEAGPPSGRAS